MMGKRSLTLGMPQRHCLGPKGASAGRIGWAKQSNHRYSQGSGQMQRAGVAPDEQPGAPGEGDKLAYGAAQLKGMSAAGLNHGCSQRFFTLSCVYQGLQSMHSQGAGHFAKAFGWPLLRSPACAGIDDDKAGNAQPLNLGLCPGCG